jgi:hypothetical protein
VSAPDRLPLGLHPLMPADEYHGIMAMSAGGLKRMRQSPAHFYGLQLDPHRPQSEQTPAMRAGTLMHLALFEPHLLATLAVRPADLDGRTKEGKAWAAEHAGRQIVSAADLATAKAQAAAVRSIPEVSALMRDGAPEQSAFWIDPETGELCKCRPDWTSPAGEGVILVDGKTCQDASADGFGRAIWNFGYHLQAAWYSDGFTAATGLKVHGFVFAAVESAWPHAAAAYMLGDDVLEAARRENRRLLNTYAECKRNGIWPGYSTGIQLVNLPKWAQLENME